MQGKVALVTGGASGIGRVTAQMFAREGVKVIVSTDANLKGAEETVRLIKEAEGEATFVKCDVSKAKEVEAMVKKTVEIYGSLDFAFNNAGVAPDDKRIPEASIVDTTEEIWDRTIGVNLKGVWLCMKYEIPQMLKQKHGAIVNTSSTGGFTGVPGLGAYSASKHGLIGLSKSAALEYAAFGIRINVISPGPTGRTLLHDNWTSAKPEMKDILLKLIPMERFAEPEEMADAVIWLCSDTASFVTGQTVTVDGGMTAGILGLSARLPP
jgi:NAD(P)-dependent dehydrogenase (short-subunit alcohol dehydrogenase family)